VSACVICGVACPATADGVQAGGDIGWCHHSCFKAFDARQEVEESAMFLGMSVPLLIAELAPRAKGRRRVVA
jgi:hypothetical protein